MLREDDLKFGFIWKLKTTYIFWLMEGFFNVFLNWRPHQFLPRESKELAAIVDQITLLDYKTQIGRPLTLLGQIKDDLKFMENGRRPWIFWQNGRRPQIFGKTEF
jgi:hypothetical protein